MHTTLSNISDKWNNNCTYDLYHLLGQVDNQWRVHSFNVFVRNSNGQYPLFQTTTSEVNSSTKMMLLQNNKGTSEHRSHNGLIVKFPAM